MSTQEKVQQYLQELQALGKKENTRRQYAGSLRRFAQAFPKLPLKTPIIEDYLKTLKETPAHRGRNYKVLQAFYSYLEKAEGITSPVPSKGAVGRPRKTFREKVPDQWPPVRESKVVGGKSVIKDRTVLETTTILTMDAVERYIAFKVAEGASSRTQEQYRGRLFPFAKAFPVLPLFPDEIAKFLSSLSLDPSTRWDYRKHIVSFYHWLEKRQEIPEIAKLFPRVKVPRKVRRVLSGEELSSLFKAARTFEETAILTLLIDSKIRASELCTLTRENVYEDHIVVTGKTGERNVPIQRETYELLGKLAEEGYLFKGKGGPMRREYLRVHVRDIMLRAGLDGKKLGPHILRHSSSVQHIMFGGDLLSLQKELGHTTTKMTEKYGELAERDVKVKHGQVNVLGHLTHPEDETRAICFGCNAEIRTKLADVKKTKCPGCGQVGKWYLPDVRSQDLAAVK
jgi:integrase